MVLSWKKVNNGTNSYIATGTLMMLDNKRFSVLSSTTSSTLLITLATPEDAGQYICEISSNPPVHMTHWLKLKGEHLNRVLLPAGLFLDCKEVCGVV